MPWKMILRLIGLAILLIFVVLNRSNTSNISLGFTTFEDVPVFLSLFVAFFAGALFSIPVAVRSSSRKNRAKTDKAIRKHDAEREAAERKSEKGKRSGGIPLLGRGRAKTETTDQPTNDGKN